MGIIADAIVEYAQPLIDATDGSIEQVERAMALSQVCWNLALLPEESRENVLSKTQSSLGMDDGEFEEFRRLVVAPMIRRHEEMFQLMHVRNRLDSAIDDLVAPTRPRDVPRGEPFPGAEPYGPCPCNSGRKYKFCCRSKGR